MSITLAYRPLAKAKIDLLIRHFDLMIGWHGVVSEVCGLFVLEDIIVYPQVCTLATCRANEPEYTLFFLSLEDYEFEHLRYHGCTYGPSRSLTPSAVSLAFEEKLCQKFANGETYFFEITNKLGDRNIRMRMQDTIVANVNVLTIDGECPSFDADAFIADAQQKIQKFDVTQWHPFVE